MTQSIRGDDGVLATVAKTPPTTTAKLANETNILEDFRILSWSKSGHMLKLGQLFLHVNTLSKTK